MIKEVHPRGLNPLLEAPAPSSILRAPVMFLSSQGRWPALPHLSFTVKLFCQCQFLVSAPSLEVLPVWGRRSRWCWCERLVEHQSHRPIRMSPVICGNKAPRSLCSQLPVLLFIFMVGYLDAVGHFLRMKFD